MIYNIALFLFWYLVWLALSWPPKAQHCIIGIFISLFVSFMTMDILSAKGAVNTPKSGPAKALTRFMWFLYYIAVFIWECVKANFDVAYRVAHPDIPIRPGTVRFKTALKSDMGLTFLANSLTLTPGRTTVDIDQQNGILYIHRLNLKEDGRESGRFSTEKRFEAILERIFE